MRSIWKARIKHKPWMDPQACAACERRFMLEECNCERVRIHQGLLFPVEQIPTSTGAGICPQSGRRS